MMTVCFLSSETLPVIISEISVGVNVTLSLGNPAGIVPEQNGAMLVLVELEGEIDTDVTVTVQTYDGSG